MELMPRKILAERSENILLLINCCFPVYLQWFFSDRSVSFAPTVDLAKRKFFLKFSEEMKISKVKAALFTRSNKFKQYEDFCFHAPCLAACRYCMSMLHVPALCPSCMSMLNVRAECPCRMSMLNVHMSILHVHAACPCCMSVLHVRAACPCCMSVLHVYAACSC
jgi:hypothetical protein